MRHARLWVGTIGIGVLVAALVWMLGDGASEPAATGEVERGDADPGHADPDVGEPLPPTSLETGPQQMSPEAARDLATRLSRALDGGLRRPVAPEGAPAAPADPATGEAPRALLRIEGPRTASDRMDYAAGLHDWIIVRRDDLRQRLAELERNGEGDSPQAGRVRWEIARLDRTEPQAEALVERVAGEVQDETQAEGREAAPEDPAP